MPRMEELTLRPATLSDAELLLAWRNEPATRAASRESVRIAPAEHADWLRGTLASVDCDLLIVELRGRPVGQVRFDRSDENYEMSVALDRCLRGKGLGAKLIAAGSRWLYQHRPISGEIEAHVRRENVASVAAFRRAGFEIDSSGGDREFLRLVFAP
jgi:RimJ/RimL family protein N-acetyltransferase